MVNITTKIAGIQFKNPTILASGILGEDAGSMQRIIECNAGGIVTKSIGLTAREGHPNPTVIELDCGILNAMGLPNPGIDNFKEEIYNLKKSKTPIIGSLYAATAADFITLAGIMEECSVSSIELNLSCPHVKKFGLEIGCNAELVKEITTLIKEQVSIPIFVKLSPNVTNIVEIANAAAEGNADGIVAINTVKAMKIDLEVQKPILSNKIGGYSGKAIKPIGVRCVYEIAKNVDIPIIGVGGIITGEDVIEYMMAGASAVQIGSGIYFRGLEIFNHICSEIEQFLKNHDYNNLSDLIGVAVE